MKLVKRLLVLTVALVAAFTFAGCTKGEKTVLTVGTPAITGDFVAGFGSSSYDVAVRDLIHGYGTLVETRDGRYVWDTTAVLVADPVTSVAAGNKTYTFELQQDLKWNNGDKIYAKDYVASMLLRSAKDWTSIATSANAGFYLVGFKEFNVGAADLTDAQKASYTVLDQKFPGVRLLGDYKFSLTIEAKHLPYFYETTMVSSGPISLKTYLPGFDIKDDGAGAYITQSTTKENIREVIAQTVNNTVRGQRYNPTVTCGPYQFVSFSGGNVVVEKNPNFKTTFDGKKPQIDEVVVRSINQDTDVQQVIAGEIDIVAGVVQGAKIEAAKAAPNVDLISYARNGYGLLAINTYFGPTQEKEVRQALGFLFDRNEFLVQILGGYGTIVNGPYGEAQWFYQESKAELDAALINYVLDTDIANQKLDASSYKFEADGVTLFDKAKATQSTTAPYLRHNAAGEVLQVNHMGTTNNPITDLIGTTLVANAWKVGMKITWVAAEWDTLLDNYYYGSKLAEEDWYYHTFNLATGFTSAYDPYWSWHSSLAGTTNNPTGFKNDEIDALVLKMQKLDPTQKEEFRQAFVEFVILWNELLPNLPLYSNEYFDVHTSRVKGMSTTPVWGWAKDICNMWIED